MSLICKTKSVEKNHAAKKRGSNAFLFAVIPFSFALLECALFLLLRPASLRPLWLGILCSLVLGGICIALPPLAARMFFAVGYFFVGCWGVAQYLYYSVFGKFMWLTDMFYASDGAVYAKTVLRYVSLSVWLCAFALIALWLFILFRWPVSKNRMRRVLAGLLIACAAAGLLFSAQRDREPDARSTVQIYETDGYYSLLMGDLWNNVIMSLLPGDAPQRARDIAEIDAWFADRPAAQTNAMTGAFAGKDLVIVLMEAIDDWLITPEEMPTLYALQQESIRFTDFYTPYYGTTRSINTQTCIDTGLYFPTDGRYFYGYLNNSFDQSLAARFRAQGYSAELFHHNWPDFYRRDELVPVLGYERYNAYVTDAGGDERAAMNDEYPFDDESVRERFFREGPTLNFVVTQAAHLPYEYDDPLSQYAFEKHPSCYGKYSCEQEDCIRAKARLVDDMFARLLKELEAEGRLENTVILALSDHYPYGYTDEEQLLRFSDNATDLLMLEKTPCFIWAADAEPMAVDKTLHTADVLPTLLNLFGISSQYNYPGQDAFDPAYAGCAFFADGSWAADGILCRITHADGQQHGCVLENTKDRAITDAYLADMAREAERFAWINNHLLSADYYRTAAEGKEGTE